MEEMKTYRERNWRKRGVKLMFAEYTAMLEKQGGVCAICGNAPKKRKLAVDHDHKTGSVRALLCIACNTALHYLENAVWRTKAGAYLYKHGLEFLQNE